MNSETFGELGQMTPVYSGFSVGVCLTDITNPNMKLIAIIMLMIKGFL